VNDELLIKAGTVIDGTGAAPLKNTDVLLRDGKIVGIGASAAVEATPEAETIDASSKTVMPGLIDAHCHTTFDMVQSNDELFFHRDPALTALTAGQNLGKVLRAGVTSLCDPDSLYGLAPSLRDAVEAEVIEGPRMSTGVQALLTAVGGTAGRLVVDEGSIGYAQVVNSVDDVITWTRRHIKYGADWIKIHATGLMPGHIGELTTWSYDELKASCDAAHELGVPVQSHCRNARSVQSSAEAGCDMILHASFMDEPALQAVIDAGASICMTFTFLANLADFGHKVGSAEGMKDVFRNEIETSAKMVRMAYDESVPLICGSESGFCITPYGHWHGREMEILVEDLGLTPLEAITCGTKNGSIAMRMEGELGTIEVGMLADVIVVDGDPLNDIKILNDRHRLSEVICRGERVDLDRPWPEHSPISQFKIGQWSEEVLTWDVAYST
jgi:imidazolonepropionase-like amidohydrolase